MSSDILDNFHSVDKTALSSLVRYCLTTSVMTDSRTLVPGLLAAVMCGILDSAPLPDESPTEQLISPLCSPEIIELHILKTYVSRIWIPAMVNLYSAVENLQYSISRKLIREIDKIESARSIPRVIHIIHRTLVKFRNTAQVVTSFQLIGDKISSSQTSSIMKTRHLIFMDMLMFVNLTITECEESDVMRHRKKIKFPRQGILVKKQTGDLSLMSHIDISVLHGLNKFLGSADSVISKLASPENGEICET